MTWDDALFDELKKLGDPPIDALVGERLSAHPRGPVTPELVRSAMAEFLAEFRAPGERPALAQRWYEEPQQPPSWMDPALLEAGQRFFADHGLEMSAALFFASLPLSYAVADAATVLRRASDFATTKLTRRVAETGRMLIDVMGVRGDGSFQPGGKAHATASGLRVLHGFVRQMIASQQPVAVSSVVPANQELLVSTIVDFTLVAWAAIERMGIAVPEEDRRAYLHTWSVVGHLLGIRADLLPLELADVDRLHELLEARHLPQGGQAATPEGVELTHALVEEMSSFMPLGWGRLPATLIRWLFHDAPGLAGSVPDALQVPPRSLPLWWLLNGQRWLNLHVRTMPVVGHVARWLSRRTGRWVIIALSARFAPGPAPFDVPAELVAQWRLPRSRAALAVHAGRSGVRRAVRQPRRTPRGSRPSERNTRR